MKEKKDVVNYHTQLKQSLFTLKAVEKNESLRIICNSNAGWNLSQLTVMQALTKIKK